MREVMKFERGDVKLTIYDCPLTVGEISAMPHRGTVFGSKCVMTISNGSLQHVIRAYTNRANPAAVTVRQFGSAVDKAIDRSNRAYSSDELSFHVIEAIDDVRKDYATLSGKLLDDLDQMVSMLDDSSSQLLRR